MAKMSVPHNLGTAPPLSQVLSPIAADLVVVGGRVLFLSYCWSSPSVGRHNDVRGERRDSAAGKWQTA